jgi:sulfatase modifying factor 1
MVVLLTTTSMKLQNTLAIAASGLLISSASATVTIDWVTVGNAGNAADTTSYGAVSYEYQIGKYEVTNAQYAAFLNAKASTDTYSLYSDSMATNGITRSGSDGSYTYQVTIGFENRPVVSVTWFDAARFSNWLANGQGSGDTETGSYDLNGVSSGLIVPTVGAMIRLPSEDEWYKAAYYNGATSTYSLYPNGQNTIDTGDANYGASNINTTTDVGTYSGDPSFYGTFDQAGNVWEWNDAIINDTLRGRRGGAWSSAADVLASSLRSDRDPTRESTIVGFRLASVAIPEPTSALIGALGAIILLRRRRI